MVISFFLEFSEIFQVLLKPDTFVLIVEFVYYLIIRFLFVGLILGGAIIGMASAEARISRGAVMLVLVGTRAIL